MKIETGKIYRTRDGRKVSPCNIDTDGTVRLECDGEYVGYVFFSTGRANYNHPPDTDYDIVGFWIEKNADGTYKLPDHNIATCWCNHSGELICWSRASNTWNGPVHVAVNPPEGRWLPLTEPTFPVRKKTELRRAKVRFGEAEYTAVRSSKKSGYPWTFPWKDDCWVCRCDSEVSVLQWLDPEYEDELPSA